METAQSKKDELVGRIAALGPMRRGSLSEQFVEATLKDGSRVRRGPYTLYTFKQGGKTVSKRLTRSAEIDLYRQQIDTFRLFQQLTAQLTDVSQQWADEKVADGELKKNSRR